MKETQIPDESKSGVAAVQQHIRAVATGIRREGLFLFFVTLALTFFLGGMPGHKYWLPFGPPLVILWVAMVLRVGYLIMEFLMTKISAKQTAGHQPLGPVAEDPRKGTR